MTEIGEYWLRRFFKIFCHSTSFHLRRLAPEDLHLIKEAFA